MFAAGKKMQYSSKPMNISTLKILPADSKSYKDQKQQQAFAKTFLFKVMTMFVTEGHHFTTFRRRLVAKETQLILLEALECKL